MSQHRGLAGENGLILAKPSSCENWAAQNRFNRAVADALHSIDDVDTKMGWLDGGIGTTGFDSTGEAGWMPPLTQQWPSFGRASFGGGYDDCSGGNDPGAACAFRPDGENHPGGEGGSDYQNVRDVLFGGRYWLSDENKVITRNTGNAWIFDKAWGFAPGDLPWFVVRKEPAGRPSTPVSDWDYGFPLVMTKDFTVVMWFNADSLAADRGMFNVTGSGDGYSALDVFIDSATSKLFVSVQLNVVGSSTIDMGVVSTGTEYLLAIRWDNANQQLDAVLVDNGTDWDDRTTGSAGDNNTIGIIGNAWITVGALNGSGGVSVPTPFTHFSGYIAQFIAAQEFWHNDQVEWFFNEGCGRKDW